MAKQGRNEEGIALMREGLGGTRVKGLEPGRPYWLSLLTEACLETGRFDDGLNALTEALPPPMHMKTVTVKERFIGSKASCC